MQNGNTGLERLMAWFCGPSGSPLLHGEGLKPTLRWVRTGRSEDARRLTSRNRVRLAALPRAINPCAHGLWILALASCIPGVDAVYILLTQLVFVAALADSDGWERS